MGLFNLFKKNTNSEDSKAIDTAGRGTPDPIVGYKEYIKLFLIMQQQGNYSPIAAYENQDGELIGHLYMNGDGMYNLSAKEVIAKMVVDLGNRLGQGLINSYAILYHSQNDDNHTPAAEDDELKAISVKYCFDGQSANAIKLAYLFEGDKITYSGIEGWSVDENNLIFNAELADGKDYFTDRVVIACEFKENEAGIKVKFSNNTSVGNTWSGFVGFDRFRDRDGSDLVEQWMKDTVTKHTITYSANNIHVAEFDTPPFKLQAVNINNDWCTFLPTIPTDYPVDVVTSEINEWQDVNNALAIVRGQGRETFGVKYLATDYAKNRQKYLSERNHKINLSGILYVLDIHVPKEGKEGSEPKFDSEFTGYIPNEDMAEYGCFDFIGKLEAMTEIASIEEYGMKGYLLNIKLINNPDEPNLFTIDLFVNKENMRFENLEVGMKLTGMFQMQGQIAE